VGLTFFNHKHIISEKGLIMLLFVEFLMLEKLGLNSIKFVESVGNSMN